MAATVEKGFELIEKKFFKQAILEITNALKADADDAYEKIINQIGEYLKSEKYEENLVLGKIALSHRPGNYQLANDLGNCARKIEDFKQAETLYNKSLKIKNDFKIALLNLAACQAGIDIYDTDLEKLISIYSETDGYLLPEGFEIDEEAQHILFDDIRKLEKIQKEQVLMLEKELYTQSGELEKVKVIKQQIDKLSADSGSNKMDQEGIDSYLKGMNKDKWKYFPKEEKTLLQKIIINSGITALQKNDFEHANFCFDRIEGNADFPYFDMLKALSKYLAGETRTAFSSLEDLLSKNPENRYLNINLGLMYRQESNPLMAYKLLIKGAFLIQQLDGIHKTSEIRKAAGESYQKKDLEKAKKLYEAIKEETNHESDWRNLGKIYYQKNQLEEACSAFHKSLKLNSACKKTLEMLTTIHDAFFNAGEKAYEENNFDDAIKSYEGALKAIRKPGTLLKAFKTYDHMGDQNKSFALKNEYNDAIARIKEGEKQELRRAHMDHGKIAIQQKDINKAIRCFEDAMSLKVDKEVVEYLTRIYKSLHRTQALQKVTARWHIKQKLQAKLKSQR
jgi:tetratricopeptide (TPR) repeat protein